MAALEKTVTILKSGGLAVDSGAATQAAAPTPQKAELSNWEKGEKEGEEAVEKLLDVADKAKNALGKLGGFFGKK
jgi:hypothetical protein